MANIEIQFLYSQRRQSNTRLVIQDCHAMSMKIFVCFVALHPKSTAMVMAGRSVYLTTLFPGQT